MQQWHLSVTGTCRKAHRQVPGGKQRPVIQRYWPDFTIATRVITRKELFRGLIVLNGPGQCENRHSIGPVFHEHPRTFFYRTPGCIHIVHEDDLLSLDFTRICDRKNAMNIRFALLLSQADLWLRIHMPPERHEVQRYMESLRYFPCQHDGLVESPFP